MNLKTNKIMTEKEKAQELVDKFLQYTPVEYEYEYAIQCALIAVDEIYYSLYDYLKDTDELQNADREFTYWGKVKQEIKKTNKI
jgi:hypothetical protein